MGATDDGREYEGEEARGAEDRTEDDGRTEGADGRAEEEGRDEEADGRLDPPEGRPWLERCASTVAARARMPSTLTKSVRLDWGVGMGSFTSGRGPDVAS